MRDPGNNGVQLYGDRPREQWPEDAARNISLGQLGTD
jgi:catechol-2,3-dioxygenase